MILQEGQTLGAYSIVQQLGAGGMATVYKAYHARLDRHVAIKVMHESFRQDPTFIARFEREARVVAKLEHPNIVPIYDFSDEQGQVYIVMKFIEGRTLKNRLSAGALALDEIDRIMTPVAAALTYAHTQGVLHRDIKPANIMIDNNGTPYLTDFGLARIAQSGESTLSTDMMLGTPHYISPEQAQGVRDLDGRTDVYSLGVILYELLVGRVPFIADTPYAIVHDHIYKPLPNPREINPEITPAIEKVLLKALAKERNDRYTTPDEMMTAYRAALNAETLDDASRVLSWSEARAKFNYSGSGTPPGGRAKVTEPDKPKRGTEPTEAQGEQMLSAPAAFADHMFDAALERIPEEDVRTREKVSQAREKARLAIQKTGKGLQFDLSFDPSDEAEDDELKMPADDEKGKMFVESNPFDEASIRKRVEQRFKDRRDFFGHIVAFALVNAMLWIAFSGQWWMAFVTFGWGAGLFAHAVETLMNTSQRDTRMEQLINEQMYQRYGDDWMNTVSQKEYKKVRKQVREPFHKREEFIQHLGVFVMINLMLALAFGFPWWQIFVFFGWGIGLVTHGFEALFSSPQRQRSREALIQREVDLARQQMSGAYEKPKHKLKNESLDADLPVRMTRDGEFTDSFVEEIDKRTRR